MASCNRTKLYSFSIKKIELPLLNDDDDDGRERQPGALKCIEDDREKRIKTQLWEKIRNAFRASIVFPVPSYVVISVSAKENPRSSLSGRKVISLLAVRHR